MHENRPPEYDGPQQHSCCNAAGPVRRSPVGVLQERIDLLRRQAHRLETLLFALQNNGPILTGESEEALVWLIDNQR